MVLDKQGIIVLPTPKINNQPSTPKRTRKECRTEFASVECPFEEIGLIELEEVVYGGSKAAGIWNEMMERYHYLGSTVCGASLRYLIRSSEHGYIGAVGFSSSIWALRERDEFIEWTPKAHRSHIQQVVYNSRFLILPGVKVTNLASHVLGQSVRRIGKDWHTRYGVEPVLLETFVDPQRFKGSSYRAANWIHVGQSSGRRAQEGEGNAKDIFVYPLCDNWKEILCKEPTYQPGEKQRQGAYADWAEEEFYTAEFYDPRLNRRLLDIARDFYRQPMAPITQASGSHARTVAAYRFFNNERVTMEELLRAHTEASIDRIREHQVVLAVQDTTTLNYTTHSTTEGLGPIGTAQQSAVGLVLHDTMAFTPDGTPLGLLDVQCWARDTDDIGKRHRRKQLPIEEKESNKWIKSYQTVEQIQKACPDTTLISVADRESDIYELFVEAAKNPDGPKLLIRSERSRNRKTDQDSLWEDAAKQEVAGYQTIHIPRQNNRLARDAMLEIRYKNVVLKPPRGKNYPPINIRLVYAREIDCPETACALEWLLLTTLEVNSFEDACVCLAYYAKRWGIEIYHRTLKSGCRIEDRQLKTAEGLQACLAIDMVVAWRIYHLTKLGREIPDAPCTVFFEEAEWKALHVFVKKNLPTEGDKPTLREAIRTVASLGGFLGRKGDREPGTTALWRGIQRLEDITATYLALLPRIQSGP